MNPRSADPSSAASITVAESTAISLRYRVNPTATGVLSWVEQTSDLRSGQWSTSNLTSNELSGELAGWRSVTLPVSVTNSAGFLRLIISE